MKAGKSTVAELSRSWHVVNDEIPFADLTGNEPRLLSIPFNGLFREKEAGNVPLAGILLLNKDRDHKVSPVGGGEAVKLIASQITPPVGLDEYLSNNHYFRQVDIASSLSRAIPLYKLYFAKDKKFWDSIDKIER